MFLTEEGLYLDNKPGKLKNKNDYKDFSVNEFYVIGNWDKGNHGGVINTIRTAVSDGINNNKFDTSDEIKINIGNRCIIDSTIASSIFHLFEKDLKNFSNKKIYVNFKNAVIFQNSTGFNMIRKYIRHMY